ncbi:glycosyltransferase family A protein [Amnibacterium sp. CER49]|uniref:glycosyltransferase family 2 protein n=1 Tax=Amnibacterium sp. CER49 TaxID=3039161 RepID=UPI00244B46B0|nr:glycosyltransferase family A protein [Amnibacterium sp. CER49]MDH2444603.1 glycosyltransferase family A protein [Amnibacterium sp. CER49]
MSAPVRAPRISLVLPVRDDAVLLRRCLEAVATLDPAPFETIVVDNGSTDGSAAVAAAAGARLVHEPRQGILPAAAAGFDAARGDVLVRFDADAVPGVDWLGRIADRFVADPALTGLTGPGVFVDLPRPLAALAASCYYGLYFGLVGGLLLGRVPLYGSNLAIRAEAWRAVRDVVHREDPDVHDDLDLTVHLGATARIRFDLGAAVAVSSRAVLSGSRLRSAAQRTRHTVRLHPEAFRATLAGRLLGPFLGLGRVGALVPPWEGVQRSLSEP